MLWMPKGSWLDFAFSLGRIYTALSLPLRTEITPFEHSSNSGESVGGARAVHMGLGFRAAEGWGRPSSCCPERGRWFWQARARPCQTRGQGFPLLPPAGLGSRPHSLRLIPAVWCHAGQASRVSNAVWRDKGASIQVPDKGTPCFPPWPSFSHFADYWLPFFTSFLLSSCHSLSPLSVFIIPLTLCHPFSFPLHPLWLSLPVLQSFFPLLWHPQSPRCFLFPALAHIPSGITTELSYRQALLL